MSDTYAPLINKIYETIDNEASWKEVLEDIARAVGAVAAIITLRDLKTARVVITPQIETELQSPLIGSLKTKEVDHYVKHLRQTDPWAKEQSKTHPYIPTLMSTLLPISMLKVTDFWPWAQSQNFNDTIVMEIDKSQNNWTAFNLFFLNENKETEEKMMEFVKLIEPHLKRAWAAGRQRIRAEVLEKHLITGVEADDRVVVLLNPQGQVVAKSEPAVSELLSGIARVDPVSKRLSIVEDLEFEKDIEHLLDIAKENKAAAKYYCLSPITGKFAELSSGELMGYSLLELKNKEDTHPIPWEDPRLDQREKLAVLTVAKTNRIHLVGDALDVSERYGRKIFKRARYKLGGISKADLVLLWKEHDQSVPDD